MKSSIIPSDYSWSSRIDFKKPKPTNKQTNKTQRKQTNKTHQLPHPPEPAMAFSILYYAIWFWNLHQFAMIIKCYTSLHLRFCLLRRCTRELEAPWKKVIGFMSASQVDHLRIAKGISSNFITIPLCISNVPTEIPHCTVIEETFSFWTATFPEPVSNLKR